jgi:hypothetical protein
MRKELEIDKFVTHRIKGLEHVNEAIEALHGGDCLRAIVEIGESRQKTEKLRFSQVEVTKVSGGHLHRIKHWSQTTQSEMTFSIFIPPR